METNIKGEKEGWLPVLLLVGKYLLFAAGLVVFLCFVMFGVYAVLEWMLLFFFIMFIILNAMLEKPYDPPIMQPAFYNYLQQIKKEAIAGDVYQFNKPYNWKKALRSRRESFLTWLSQFLLAIYILSVILLTIHQLGGPWHNDNSITSYMKILASLSIIPVFVWLWRKAYCDGSTQGYLKGYIDGLQSAMEKRSDG